MEHSKSSKFSAAALRVDERRSMMFFAVTARRAVVSSQCTAGRLNYSSRRGDALAALRLRVIETLRKALCGSFCTRFRRRVASLLAPGLSPVFVLSQPVAFGATVRHPRRARTIDCWQQ